MDTHNDGSEVAIEWPPFWRVLIHVIPELIAKVCVAKHDVSWHAFIG